MNGWNRAFLTSSRAMWLGRRIAVSLDFVTHFYRFFFLNPLGLHTQLSYVIQSRISIIGGNALLLSSFASSQRVTISQSRKCSAMMKGIEVAGLQQEVGRI